MSHPRRHGARRLANKLAHFAGETLRCAWCRRPMTYRESTTDHVIPRRLGGSTRVANLKASCWRCNQFRAVELHLLFGEISAAEGLLRRLARHDAGIGFPYHQTREDPR